MSGEMLDADGDVVGENLNPRASGRLWVIAGNGKRRLVADTCGRCGELVRVGEPHSHRRAPPARGWPASRRAPAGPPAPEGRMTSDSVEVIGSTDAAREFWQAFASIAADLLDEGDLLSEDHSPTEEAA